MEPHNCKSSQLDTLMAVVLYERVLSSELVVMLDHKLHKSCQLDSFLAL